MITVNRAIPKDKLKLLIFDLDGTLVDSRKDLANSINAMLQNYHRPQLADDTIATYIGDGAPTLVRRSLGFIDDHALNHKEEEFIEDALVFFLEYYREHKLDFTYVYDGVIDALQQIAAANNGMTMSVLSNKPVNPSRAIVNALGLKDFFRSVYGGNSFETKKPDPLGVNTLLREAGVSAEEAVIIGDSDIDMLTGRNAGIWSCGVTYGLSPETLARTPGDVMVDSPREWVGVFKN
ncbi:MAG: putative phosphoglycolate phosphatase [Acidobacteriales bacterium]|nr:putative phosphoglycolate phosphatase [Terriglobales bacterium]